MLYLVLVWTKSRAAVDLKRRDADKVTSLYCLPEH